MMSIDCATFETLLADAIGGELNDQDRIAFESHVNSCNSCRAEFRSMVATIETVRNRLSSDNAAASTTHPPAPSPRRRRRGVTLLRYAAAVAVAFLAGYGFRGTTTGPTSPNTVDARAGAITVEQQLVIAHRRAPKASAFTKSVLAVLGTPPRNSR